MVRPQPSATCIITNCRRAAPATEPFCSHHKDKPGSVTLTSAAQIYPNRPDLADNWRWLCSCGAHCGTHPNLTAVGTPAAAETRNARMAAHAVFDPLWQKRMRISGITQKAARGRAYKWLAEQMGIDRKHCHIGMMSAQDARKVVEICASIRSKSGKN